MNNKLFVNSLFAYKISNMKKNGNSSQDSISNVLQKFLDVIPTSAKLMQLSSLEGTTLLEINKYASVEEIQLITNSVPSFGTSIDQVNHRLKIKNTWTGWGWGASEKGGNRNVIYHKHNLLFVCLFVYAY